MSGGGGIQENQNSKIAAFKMGKMELLQTFTSGNEFIMHLDCQQIP